MSVLWSDQRTDHKILNEAKSVSGITWQQMWRVGQFRTFFCGPFFFFFFCLYWISYNIGSVLFWSVGCKVWRILTPWSEIEPTLSAMEGSLNHWTTGKSRVGQFRRRNMQKVYFYLCVTASHYPQEGKQAWGDNTLTEKVLV